MAGGEGGGSAVVDLLGRSLGYRRRRVVDFDMGVGTAGLPVEGDGTGIGARHGRGGVGQADLSSGGRPSVGARPGIMRARWGVARQMDGISRAIGAVVVYQRGHDGAVGGADA